MTLDKFLGVLCKYYMFLQSHGVLCKYYMFLQSHVNNAWVTLRIKIKKLISG